jgi:hypothetical protein
MRSPEFPKGLRAVKNSARRTSGADVRGERVRLIVGQVLPPLGDTPETWITTTAVRWFRNLIVCWGDKVKIRVASKDGRAIAGILTLLQAHACVQIWLLGLQIQPPGGNTTLVLEGDPEESRSKPKQAFAMILLHRSQS